MNKLLIVEDDQLVANIYRNKFLLEDFKVELAPDAETALQVIKEFQPDAVLLDLVLPRMSGVELMKEIRKETEFKTLPLVVFSNTFLTSLVREAWQAGATKCLSKANCTPNQVITAVRNALSGQSSGVGTTPAKPEAMAAPRATRNLPQPHRMSQPHDAAIQGELRQSFLDSLPATLNSLRTLLQGLNKAEEPAARQKILSDLARHVHSVSLSAAAVDMEDLAQLTEALEALLKDLHEKPKNLTASPVRTIASAIDVMALQLEEARGSTATKTTTPRILVVDDEPISRRAITHALELAKLSALSLEDPTAAYKLLASNSFDLIFLDVDMPGMTGFELCTKLRNLPAHEETPVVFITSLDDFESRASSTVSGGNDFIAKPFLFLELAVKALIYLLRRGPKKAGL